MNGENWAVVIGINRYWAASANLERAVPDALGMREWLLHPNGGGVMPERLFLLLAPTEPASLRATVSEANQDNIFHTIRNLEEQSGDRFFFYFSGHGIIAPIGLGDQTEVLIPTDCAPERPQRALPLWDIVESFKYLRFDEQYFFIDACRNMPWAGDLRFPRFPFPGRGRQQQVQQFVFFATSPHAEALEVSASERGVFTGALLKGLSSDGDAKKWDAASERYIVTVDSLFDYVTAEVRLTLEAEPFIQVPRRAGESGRADGGRNDPILAAFEAPLPRPDPARFSVAIANLGRDATRDLEKLLVDQLGSIGETVQVLRLGRPIIEGFQPEERDRTARERALKYLRETGIDGLIWGEALSLDNRTGARLHFTTLEETTRPDSPYPINDFSFPEIFWEDLCDFLCLIVSEKSTEFYLETTIWEGRRPIIRQLDSYIQKIRRLLDATERQRGWTADSRASLKAHLAVALMTSEQQSRVFAQESQTRPAKLKEAAGLFKSALEEWTEGRDFERRSTLGNLAIAQKDLGGLQEAVDIFRKLADLYDSSQDPWFTRTLNLLNFGNTLCQLGDHLDSVDSRARQFEEAATIYEKAMDSSPSKSLVWAAASEGRAAALLGLARNKQSQVAQRRLLAQAEADVRRTLSVFTRDEQPLRWANATHKLAVILRRRGESDPGIARLEQAVTILQELVTGYPIVPSLPWALYTESLANALSTLGKRTNNSDRVREALKIRASIIPTFRAENDYDGATQCRIDAREDVRILLLSGVSLDPWLEDNKAALEKIDPGFVAEVRALAGLAH